MMPSSPTSLSMSLNYRPRSTATAREPLVELPLAKFILPAATPSGFLPVALTMPASVKPVEGSPARRLFVDDVVTGKAKPIEFKLPTATPRSTPPTKAKLAPSPPIEDRVSPSKPRTFSCRDSPSASPYPLPDVDATGAQQPSKKPKTPKSASKRLLPSMEDEMERMFPSPKQRLPATMSGPVALASPIVCDPNVDIHACGFLIYADVPMRAPPLSPAALNSTNAMFPFNNQENQPPTGHRQGSTHADMGKDAISKSPSRSKSASSLAPSTPSRSGSGSLAPSPLRSHISASPKRQTVISGSPPNTRSSLASSASASGHGRIRSHLSTASSRLPSSPVDDDTIMHEDGEVMTGELTPGRRPAGLERTPEERRQGLRQGRARMMQELDESA